MSTYYANDKYSAVLTAGYSVDQTTLYVSAVPNHVPTIIVAAKGTDNETVFAVTGKTTNSLTGVSRLRGANVDLDAQTPLTCLNNEEFTNQSATVNAIFYEEHDETGRHTTDVRALVGNLAADLNLTTTHQTVVFTSETEDPSSSYSTTTGVFTTPVAGIYMVSFMLRVQGFTANDAVEIILKDKTINIIATAGGFSIYDTVMLKCSASEEIKISIRNTTAARGYIRQVSSAYNNMGIHLLST